MTGTAGTDHTKPPPPRSAGAASGRGSALEVLAVATRLGLTSFGGPVAHLGYFREEYVVRRRWLDEQSYVDLVALCQFLPGPASSQVGIAAGLTRAGFLGGLAAWLGFTLPSALALTAFAYAVRGSALIESGWLVGLRIVAVPIVAQAVWGMGRQFCADRLRATFALVAALTALALPTASGQLTIIAVAGLLGWRFLGSAATGATTLPRARPNRGPAALALLTFLTLLLILPVLARLVPEAGIVLFDSFYRAGALVFGGGHVVLPLLQHEVVPRGWLTNAQFVAGYGAAQAVPGPLFTFAAYLGAARAPAPNGLVGAALAIVAIFLPSFLLVTGALPFWNALRALPTVRAALHGINAAVVGLLFAALYSPVWTSAIESRSDFALALGAGGLLIVWKAPAWLVVLLTALGGAVLHAFQ